MKHISIFKEIISSFLSVHFILTIVRSDFPLSPSHLPTTSLLPPTKPTKTNQTKPCADYRRQHQ